MTTNERKGTLAAGHLLLEDLAAYHEGHLPAEENDRIRSHLIECGDCADVVLDVAAAAGLESVPATFPAEIADSWDRLRDAVDKEGLWQRARVASIGQSNGWKALALAASVAAVLFAGSSLWLWRQSSLRIPPQVDPPWVGLASAEDLRSGEAEVRQVLRLSPGTRGWISFAYKAPDSVISLQVRFFPDSESMAVWEWSGPRPEDPRILRMELTSRDLNSGSYRIELDGRARSEDDWILVARYSLEIVGHEGS